MLGLAATLTGRDISCSPTLGRGQCFSLPAETKGRSEADSRQQEMAFNSDYTPSQLTAVFDIKASSRIHVSPLSSVHLARPPLVAFPARSYS